MPPYWVGIILVMSFSYWIRLFPMSGMTDTMYAYLSPGQQLLDRLQHLALPAITLTLLNAPEVARYQRAALLEILPEDYLRTARAKGLSERRIMVRHALRNALLPTIAVFGLSFPTLVGGTVFVETVFSWQGMGLMAVNAFSMRDYPMVVATVIAGSSVVVVGNLIADLLSAAANPRLRTA
jgi:peptide/nickel transport system permease protein